MDDAGHAVMRTFTSEGTETTSYSIDNEHYYITDLTTGQVTITPETFGEIIVDDEGDDIIHYRHDNQDVYLHATVDEMEDMIVMDGLDEDQNEVNAFIYRSSPWNSFVVDGENNDILSVIEMDFDTVINNTFESFYESGTFETDSVSHNQNGALISDFDNINVVDFIEGEVVEASETYVYTERTYDSVTAMEVVAY